MTSLTQKIRHLCRSVSGKQLASVALWSVIGEVASKGLFFLSMIVVARILGKQGYGELGIIRTTINMFATVGGLGLGLTANRYIAQARDTDKPFGGQVVGLTYALSAVFGLLAGILLFFCADYLGSTTLHAPQLSAYLRLAAALLFLGAINGAQIGILQGLGAYRRLALTNVCQGMAAFALFIGGAHFFGLRGTLAAFVLHSALSVAILEIAIGRELKIQQIARSYTGLRLLLPLIWRFSIPAALAGIVVAPFKWASESLLTRTSGFEEIGVFYASFTVTTIFIALVSTINAPLLSLAANSINFRANSRIKYLSLYGSWYLFIILAVPLILFPDVVDVFFGKQFEGLEFKTINLLLLLYGALMMYYQGLVRLMALNNTLWLAVLTNLFEGIALFTACAWFGDFGSVGLAIAYVVSYALRIAITFPLINCFSEFSARNIVDRYFVASAAFLVALVCVQLIRGA